MTLKGKHALVTGSSRGIGRGIALKLAEKGAHVAVHFYQNEEITLEKWDTAVDSQAKAFLVGVREAARLMREGGRIIAITFAPGGGLEAGSRGWPWERRKLRWKC
jgi:NAD(P)-dependent dehydrogenase (short-subunit alcohol dehydrogenase family)